MRNFLISFLLLCLAACAGTSDVTIPENTTLIVVRHSDRSGENLNDVGIARSKALVTALEGIPVDAIYLPGLQRNIDTALPLSEARDIPLQRIGAEDPAPTLMRLGAGKTILWVGNKGNLATIWESLGAADPPPLQYGDLYIVTRAASGQPDVERRRFGP